MKWFHLVLSHPSGLRQETLACFPAYQNAAVWILTHFRIHHWLPVTLGIEDLGNDVLVVVRRGLISQGSPGCLQRLVFLVQIPKNKNHGGLLNHFLKLTLTWPDYFCCTFLLLFSLVSLSCSALSLSISLKYLTLDSLSVFVASFHFSNNCNVLSSPAGRFISTWHYITWMNPVNLHEDLNKRKMRHMMRQHHPWWLSVGAFSPSVFSVKDAQLLSLVLSAVFWDFNPHLHHF